MKIGCCTNMVSTAPDGTGIEWIEKLDKYGYDYVELPLAQMEALSQQDFSALVERLEKTSIRCEVCNNFFPTTLSLTGENVSMDAIDDYLKTALERAQRLGVETIVFGSGPAKNVPDGFPMEKGYGQVVSLLKHVAPQAAKRGITIVIEPLRKPECNLINSFREGCALARDVAADNVKVLVDYYHMSEENEPASNVAEDGNEFLRHVHFAKQLGRSYPETKQEDSRYIAFFDALKTAAYDKRISLEAYTNDFDKEAPLALAFLRNFF